METIEHLLGLCGESHPNLFIVLAILLVFKTSLYLVYKNKKSYLN